MKEVKVIESVDYHGCETCGMTTEYSTTIHYGEWSYGEIASAHCYDSRTTEYSEAFDELLKHLDLPKIPVTEARPYASKMEYVSFLENHGFTVVLCDVDEEDEDYTSLYDIELSFSYRDHED